MSTLTKTLLATLAAMLVAGAAYAATTPAAVRRSDHDHPAAGRRQGPLRRGRACKRSTLCGDRRSRRASQAAEPARWPDNRADDDQVAHHEERGRRTSATTTPARPSITATAGLTRRTRARATPDDRGVGGATAG